MASGITVADLKAVPVFAAESDEHLEWLAAQMVESRHVPGDLVWVYGQQALEMVVVLEGSVQLLRHVHGTRRLFETVGPGGFSGLLPYSRMVHYGGDAVVVKATRLARLNREHFTDMVHRMPAVGQALVGMMTDRVRGVARGDQQIEKMMALGKLSAGLAHELNNPAAAVSRAAAALRERLRELEEVVTRLSDHGLSGSELEETAPIRAKARERVLDHSESAVNRSEREDALAEWLEERGVEEAWTFGEVFADAGMTIDDLELVADRLAPEASAAVIAWLALTLDADRLLQEIEAASRRISDLVGSVKAYSHMDRAPEKMSVDVREGLENTLTMLSHRLKSKSIAVEKQYEPDLPAVEANPGELNQVWTNLIDNAIDAMSDGGKLHVGARKEGGMVAVTVTDNGPGISPDVVNRIFEPFFTTKEVGEGTGLGLDIVERIVRDHGGDVSVDTVPGRTTFRVSIPTAA